MKICVGRLITYIQISKQFPEFSEGLFIWCKISCNYCMMTVHRIFYWQLEYLRLVTLFTILILTQSPELNQIQLGSY